MEHRDHSDAGEMVAGVPEPVGAEALSISLVRKAARLVETILDVHDGTSRYVSALEDAKPRARVIDLDKSGSQAQATEIPALQLGDIPRAPGGRILLMVGAPGRELLTVRALEQVIDSAEAVRVFVEVDRGRPGTNSSEPSDLVEWLTTRGFEVFAIEDGPGTWSKLPTGAPAAALVAGDSPLVLYGVRGAEVLSVAAVVPSGQLRGAERTHLEWATAMHARGHLVHTFVGDGVQLSTALTRAGLPNSHHHMGWWVGPGDWSLATAGVQELSERLAQLTPDVVLTITGVLPGGALAARALGLPHIWWVHEYIDLDHGLQLPETPRALGAAIAQLSDVVLANSPSVFRHLFVEREPRIAVPLLPSGPSARPTANAPREVGVHPVLGIFGAITERKGHLDLIHALGLLRERGLTPGLRIYGTCVDEPFRLRLENTIATLSLDTHIEFAGETADPGAAMAQMDAVVVPSWHEAFGQVPIEAIDVGVPVVYSAAGGLADYMVDGVTGVAAEPRSPASLADAIERTLTEQELRAELSSHALPTLAAALAPLDALPVLERAIEEVRDARSGWPAKTVERLLMDVVRESPKEPMRAELARAQAEARVSAADGERAQEYGDQVTGALSYELTRTAWMSSEKERLDRELTSLATSEDRPTKVLDPVRHRVRRVRLRTGNLLSRFSRRRWASLFDSEWYLANNDDVRESGADPVAHYRRHGAAEGRDPHPLFMAAWYVSQYADVAESGQNPLEHYVARGAAEGRWPNPEFDTDWYVRTYPDVRESGMNPLLHYWRYGWREGRVPSSGWRPPPSEDSGAQCPLVRSLHAGGLISEADRTSQLPVRAADARLGRLAERAFEPALTPPAATPLTVIAFYLPQFHRIPENDEWWGEGYTEWTAVRRGKPVFPGHRQPRVPGDLGYYDLAEDPTILHRQAQMARNHGVDAFCFYVYWFGGARLLETPVERFLADPSIDIGFTVCWANENWTRTWDGDSSSGLMVQDHSPDDDVAFIDALIPALLDPRAVRVATRPLLVVYRPGLLPDPKATAERWRERCRDRGIGEIVLAYVRSFDTVDPRDIGFDFEIEFPPPHMGLQDITSSVPFDEGFHGVAWDLAELSKRAPETGAPPPRWRGTCPSWDNTPRRPSDGAILIGENPVLFRDWLYRAGAETIDRIQDPSARLLFVNAWNEWSEGAYLEPDSHMGYQWLHGIRDTQETLAGVTSGTGPGLVVVAHDMHQHGAQLLSLAMVRWLAQSGFRVEVVALGPGALESEFRSLAPLHIVDDRSARDSAMLAADLHGRGFRTALCNSSVTGQFAYYLSRAGVDVTGLVHELPEILKEAGRGRRAAFLPSACRRLVFPAESVRTLFPYPVGAGTEVVILPQGLYSERPALANASDAASLRERLGLPEEARIVLGVGSGDRRKGFDLFCEVITTLTGMHDDAYGVWLGRVEDRDPDVARSLRAVPSGRLILPGFVEDPARFYSGADAFALTSREDPFPSVVLEAVSAGLPCVAFSGCTGLESLLVESAGEVVEPFDVPSFVGAVVRGWQRSIGLAVRRRDLIETRFSFHGYMMALLQDTALAPPKVSVIIPNYNYEHYLADRIAQILAQSLPPFEIIVLDDASTDDSMQTAREALEGCGIPWKLVPNGSNGGSVINQWLKGIALASGDFIWIAEADDRASSHFLKEVTAAFSRSEVVLSYCQSRQMDQAGDVFANDSTAYIDGLDRDFTRPYTAEGLDELARCLSVRNSIPNVSAVVFRTRPLKRAVAACREELLHLRYAADWRLYVQLLTEGSIAFSPRSLNDHRRHSRSVIGAGDASEHVREIAEVQRVVAAVLGIEGDRDAALQWRREAASLLGPKDAPEQHDHSGPKVNQ